MACSDGLDLALGAGVAGFGFSIGGGCIYTRSVEGAIGSGHLVAWAVAVRLFLGWAVALEFNFMGIG